MRTRADIRLNPSKALSTRTRCTAAVLVAMLSLTGCASLPGMSGTYPQQPGRDNYGGGYGSERIVGTVQSLDRGYSRIVLMDESRGYGAGGAMEIYFDRDTRLVYRGQAQAVEGLERGDRIAVDAVQSGGRLFARHIEVVQNVRESGGGYGRYPDSTYPGGAQPGGTYSGGTQPGAYPGGSYPGTAQPGGTYNGSELQGAIGQVDHGRRRITLNSGGYNTPRREVLYDELTQVEYRGQRVRPDDLEAGDVIRVRGRPVGSQFIAEQIWVEANARSR